jgi:hypothetical protein
MSFITSAAKRLFTVPEEPRPWFRIVLWWELRRIAFNLLVGFVGFISLSLFIYIALKHPKDFQDGPEPFSVFIFAVMANVCYTGGWIWELAARFLWKEKAIYFGPIMFSLGLIFSMLAALAPSLIVTAIYCFSKS